jgi:hypothetical protein
MRSIAMGILLALSALSPIDARATSQEPDELLIDGELLDLETNPLRPLIRSGAIKIPKADETWSSNWRGYTSKWELRGDQLLLRSINVVLRPVGGDKDAKPASTNVLSSVFQGKSEVFARWYTGTLVLPRGKVLRYVHMGYGSTYERYTILQFRLGVLTSRQDLASKQFEELRKQKFAAYRKTSEYAERLKDARKNLSPSSAENFLYEYAVEEYMSVAQ